MHFEKSLPGITAWTAVLIRDEHDRVLLLHRAAAGPRAWQLPGGHLDHREYPADAALRELAEETGIGPAHPARFVGLDFALPAHGWAGCRVALFFDGGRRAAGDLGARLTLSGEHDAWDLRSMTDWQDRMKHREWQRLHSVVGAADSGTALYLHEMGTPA
ncbi:NUDIX domain-containing protein [Streptomyces sp. NPDC049881]|uniref:NUDIX hydrolase n=1 Tax=Streptomyces sp. NPDC049881 TaxID=3155778 RepID=UPI0034284092